LLQSGSNPDFDLKRWLAQSGRLSMNFYVHMGNLGLDVFSPSLLSDCQPGTWISIFKLNATIGTGGP